MKNARRLFALTLSAGILAVIVVAGLTLATDASAAGACRCPLIYAPVACDHGKTYPNQCVADCHNAKNCVPTGI